MHSFPSSGLVCVSVWFVFRFSEAEQDCSAALALDASYAKAFARRATARAALGRIRDAKEGPSSLTFTA